MGIKSMKQFKKIYFPDLYKKDKIIEELESLKKKVVTYGN